MPTLRIARYRFQATWRARAGGSVALALLVALLGGIAMAAVAGARRTQSSYPAFLASTNPSDLSLETASVNPGSHPEVGYDPAAVAQLRRLPHVRHAESYGELNVYPLDAHGQFENISVPVPGSVDGLYFDEDRITVVEGRRANPAHADEITVSADVARLFHLHVGSTMSWAFYDNSQNPQPGIPASRQRPHLQMRFRLMGIGVLNDAVIQDDIDAQSAAFVLFTPALTSRLTECCTQNTETALQLDGGPGVVAAVEREIARVAPAGRGLNFAQPSISVAKAQRALEPDSIALAVFGLIAGLAALLIAGQVVGRQLRARAPEVDVMRALGASPATTAADGLIGVVGAVLVGSVLAAGVAVALSGLAPIGPVRPLYPHRGIAFDWTVLGLGVLVLSIVLGATAALLALRVAPHRVACRSRVLGARPSKLARRAADTGFSAPAVAGIRFALEPGAAANPVPVRSAIFGAALAVVVVVSTVTFGASLHALVSRPRLYGWNWSYELTGGGSVGAIPAADAAKLLDGDRAVAAWSPVYYYGVGIDGHEVPLLGSQPGARVAPPVLSGHALASDLEIVLGALTLSQLHKHIGDTILATTGLTKPTRLRIVGTATMPTIGIGGPGSRHLTMGDGAIVASQLMAPTARDLVGNVPAGPEGILVRLRPGVDVRAARRGLARIATKLTRPTNYGVEVDAVERPAEIVNYRSTTSTPAYLGAALAAGAVVALALTLVASVRRRRRDLALLKTIGFTRRQVAAAVAWQATIAVGLGTIVGVPIGVVSGRLLWNLFANGIHAVPDPIVPGTAVALIALGSLVLANVVAAIPAIRASGTPPSLLLRTE